MQSRENGQKPQFGQFFDDFEVKYLQIANFSEKQVSFKLKVIFSTNFRPKTKKINGTVFEKNIKVSDFGLIWRPFHEYLQIKNFYQKSGSATFLPSQSPSFMQKIRKILTAVSEKTALPTNQPASQLLPTTPILQDLADAGPKNNQEQMTMRKEFEVNIGLKYIILNSKEGNPLDTIMAPKYNFIIKIYKISTSSQICGGDFHY